MAQAFADLTAIALLGQPNRAAHPHTDTVDAVPADAGAVAGAEQVDIEQATGILAERGQLTIIEARDRLHRHAHTHDITISDAAREILAGRVPQHVSTPETAARRGGPPRVS